MKTRPLLLLLPLLAVAATAHAREAQAPLRTYFSAEVPRAEAPPAYSERADTLFLFAASGSGAWGAPGTDDRGYTFDDGAGGPATAGWSLYDASAQLGAFWHLQALTLSNGHGTDFSSADDFADGGPTAGNDFAWWCGVENVCGWVNAAGYGNNWDQYLVLDVPPGATGGTIAFDYVGDFEGDDYDHFTLYAATAGVFDALMENRVSGEQTVLHVGPLAFGDVDSLVLAFHSDHAWSDQEGWFSTDIGAVWIDNLVVDYDGAPDIAWDFESGIEADYPALHAATPKAAGAWGALYANLFAEDPCFLNPTNAWAFFDYLHTTNPDVPLPSTPYGPPYFDNGIESPVLSRAHALGEAAGAPLEEVLASDSQLLLRWLVYRDLPLNALVFFEYALAAETPAQPCLGPWANDNTVYNGTSKRWDNYTLDTTLDLTASAEGNGATGLVVRLGAVDMCSVWCNVWGDGVGHTWAPFFDNVQLMVVNGGPVAAWDARVTNRFQDNFPEAGTGKVRIDAANDIQPPGSGTLAIGDSACVRLDMDGDGGIATDYASVPGEQRPQLYLYARVIDGPHTGSTDPAMGDPDRSDGIWSPWIGTTTVLGETWNVAIADTARWQGHDSPNNWAFDFAEDYFEPGDVIEFYYRAASDGGATSTHPQWAESADPFLRIHYTLRCLPTAGVERLFVEDGGSTSDFPEYWLQTVWREAFVMNGQGEWDVYKTQAPSSGLNNGLAGRAEPGDLAQYRMIIWDSGALQQFTISNALPEDLVFDDALLESWLNGSQHDTGLWVLGNGVASDLDDAPGFLNDVLGARLLLPGESYDALTGIMVPRVNVTDPLLEVFGQTPYFAVMAGCPTPQPLDLVGLEPSSAFARAVMEYENDGGVGAVASVFNPDPDGDGELTSPTGFANRTVFTPFSYQLAQDTGFEVDHYPGYVRRMVDDVLERLFGVLGDPIAADPVPARTAFDGAYPNPFNPSTTLRFALAAPAHARLYVYDLAGRRVRSLVDAELPAAEHEAVWDGHDDRGTALPSGVYFARLTAGDFARSQKVLLLK